MKEWNIQRLAWWLVKLLMFWVRSKISPLNPLKDIEIDPDKPLVYALHKNSLTDLMVLYHHLKKLGLPRPRLSLTTLINTKGAAHYCLKNPGWLQSKASKDPSKSLVALVEQVQKDPNFDVQILPVSVLWGKSPGAEEKSLFRALFSDDENAGILQKFFIILMHGRENRVHFAQTFRLKENIESDESPEIAARRFSRILRIHFRRQRTATLGQKLVNRDQVIKRVVRSKNIQEFIETEGQKSPQAKLNAETKAALYADEIAADLNYSTVRFAEIILHWMWRKLFSRIEHKGLEELRELHQDYEIVYMPTHRSHVDYLLMTYTLFTNGLPMPHTAAGINLDFFPFGWLVRRWGGFFIRRSFGGNRLYTLVFSEYIHDLMTHGYPITFYPEGGRSRTGRLLSPKTGMLGIVLQSYRRKLDRPVAVVPTFIAYDRVMEIQSYLKELSGGQKQKESAVQMFSALRFLKQHYGIAHVHFAKPLFLHEHIRTEEGYSDREVNDLAYLIACRTNAAAMVSAHSLFVLSLLSHPQKALSEEALLNYAEALRTILTEAPFSDSISIPKGDLKAALVDTEKLGTIMRYSHVSGDVIHVPELERTGLQYYANNVLHLFALPALIARAFHFRESLGTTEIAELTQELFPYLAEEYFVPWQGKELFSRTYSYLKVFGRLNWLIYDPKEEMWRRPPESSELAHNLLQLGHFLGQSFEYWLLASALVGMHTQTKSINTETFVDLWAGLLKRQRLLSGKDDAPELNSLQKKVLNFHRQKKILLPIDENNLQVEDQAFPLGQNALKLLAPELRLSVQRIAKEH